MSKLKSYVLATMSSTLLATAAMAEASSTLSSAVTGGTVNADLRLRYEAVGQDNAREDADAVTLRTLLGYTTKSWNDLTGFVEMENVNALVDDYSIPGGPVQRYSIVADPDDTELNQWGIRYAGIRNLSATIGRSKLILDNARWVGNVGWRQNEQTYDGVFLKYTPLSSLTLQYDYLSNVNDIFFNNVDLNGHLFNFSWAALPQLTLIAYGYLLDFESPAAADSDTVGLRATGAVPVGEALKILYTAEFATQDAETANADFNADYFLGELGLAFKGVTGKLGYEVLGSDDGAFVIQTPLATLHAFNGWSDAFLPAVPSMGLEDTFVSLGASLGKVNLLAVYHDYQSDEGSIDYGSEIDLLATMPLADKLTGGIKYGDYSADQFSVDTDKLWVWLQFKF